MLSNLQRIVLYRHGTDFHISGNFFARMGLGFMVWEDEFDQPELSINWTYEKGCGGMEIILFI